MNRVETQARAPMKHYTLQHILRINVDDPSFAEFNPLENIKQWTGTGNRHHKRSYLFWAQTKITGTRNSRLRQ